MRRRTADRFVSIGLLLLGFVTVSANARAEELAPPVKAFVNGYRQALHAKNQDQRRALMHPDYRRCMEGDAREYFEDLFRRECGHEIPEAYEVSLTPLSKEEVARQMKSSRAMGMPYPAEPTHRLQLDFKTGPYASVTMLRYLVVAGDQVSEVSGCPGPPLLAKFRDLKVRKEQEWKRAVTLAGQVKDPLRSQLLTLIKEGRSVEAMKIYSESSGETLSTAKDVVALLFGELSDKR